MVINDEKDLIVKLRAGSQPAFTTLYNLYSGRLLGRLIRLTKAESTAVEILQEVFIKIWNTRESLDPEKSFRSYLFRITENLVVDYYRKALRDKKLMDHLSANAAVAHSLPEEELYKKENITILREIIDHLPAQRKNVFTLVKLEGKSYHEVAALLNISTSTISDHIVKATKFIRDRLAANPYWLLLLVLQH